MVKAEFTALPKEGLIAMKVTGHAQTAAKGQDLVCASASILALTLAQAVGFANQEGKLQREPRMKIAEGKTIVIAKPTPEAMGEIIHAFYMAQVGFSILATVYKDNVQLTSFDESIKGFNQ